MKPSMLGLDALHLSPLSVERKMPALVPAKILVMPAPSAETARDKMLETEMPAFL
jgi:hypothetical protein